MHTVVVTGLGTINPCGNDVERTWESVCASRSGIGPITRFDASDWSVRIAGEVKNFNARDHLPHKAARKMDPYSHYAMVATHEAMVDAGLGDATELGERAGVYVGSGIGGIGEIADTSSAFDNRGHKAISPFFIPRALSNLAVGHIAQRYGAQGPSLCISTACATGNHSIGEAWRVIRSGDADLVIAGGTEAAVVPIGIAGFMSMRALSTRNDDPQTASRPFDAERDGFVMGEGAGILVMESLEHARARGARIYAEVVGYGLTNDAHHMTAPPPGHTGAVRCMRMALRSAGLAPEQVDYINAHGTSTPANDKNETQAIRTVLGAHADQIVVSSTKSMTGHLLGAAGGLEAVLTVKAMQTGIVPPTATLKNPDPECDLDYCSGSARPQELNVILSNAFGFGGTNACLVMRRYTDG